MLFIVVIRERFKCLSQLITERSWFFIEQVLSESRGCETGFPLTHFTAFAISCYISGHTKPRLLNSLVFPIFYYSAETWTIKAEDQRIINTSQLRALTKNTKDMVDGKQNDWVDSQRNWWTQKCILLCNQRILHTVRQHEVNLEKSLLREKLED